MPIPIDLLLRLHFLVGRLRLDPPALKRFQSYPSIELNDDFKEPIRFRDKGLFFVFVWWPLYTRRIGETFSVPCVLPYSFLDGVIASLSRDVGTPI
jgi:hypothetical protein